MKPTDSPDLPSAVRTSWQHFAEAYEPLRPELFRYCRHLTRSPFDAEDLAQDTLARAFVTLGRMGAPPPNPRAWLFRVASNLWLDRATRTLPQRATVGEASTPPTALVETREAAGTLLVQLAPQERVAVVLKDVYGMSLEEIASTLGTTTGAVKAALHRGRGKLLEPEVETPRVPAHGVLDAFCEAFNAHDLERLRALLADTASVEVVGASTSFGVDAQRSRMLGGMLFGSERLAHAETRGGIEPRYVQQALPTPPRVEVREWRGEPLVLVWYAHRDGEAVRGLHRLETEGSLITRLANYFYSPEVLLEVCAELGVPCRVNGLRWWSPGVGGETC